MAQIDSQTKQIGDHKFETYKLPWDTAQDILLDLLKVIGPVFGKVADLAGDDDPGDWRLDSPEVATVISTLIGQLDKGDLRRIINAMAKVSKVDNVPLEPVMAEIFRGDLPLLYGWLWFALRANYANFFEPGRLAAVGLTVPAFMTKSKSAGPQPANPRGASG